MEEAEELREEGNALFAQGDYAAACAKYEVARPPVCAPRYPLCPRFPRLSCRGRPSPRALKKILARRIPLEYA